MEIIFLLTSIIITLLIIYGIGRTQGSHSELIMSYKRSDLLVLTHLFFGMILIIIICVTLCALNNTFWHLSYLTV